MEEVLHELVGIILVDEPLHSSPIGDVINIILVSIFLSLLHFEVSQHSCLLEINHLQLVVVPVLHQQVNAVNQVQNHCCANDEEENDGAYHFGWDLRQDVREHNKEHQASQVEEFHDPHVPVQVLVLVWLEPISPNHSKDSKEHNGCVSHLKCLCCHAVAEYHSPKEEVKHLE